MKFLKSRLVQWSGLVAIALLILAGFSLRRKGEVQAQLLTPLPQDPQIQVYFNHAESAAYTEPYRQHHRLGDDLEQLVVTAINQAQTSIEVAVHELNLPGVATALKERHQAGVKV